MSIDPIVRLAKLRIIKASADLEVQLASVKGGGPAVEIARRFQDRAAESLAALAFVDASETDKIRTFQNEVKRYDEWIVSMREIISEGITYDKEFTEADRNEMVDILRGTEDGERQLIELGLVDDIPRDA